MKFRRLEVLFAVSTISWAPSPQGPAGYSLPQPECEDTDVMRRIALTA
jgi:hypothetical protein